MAHIRFQDFPQEIKNLWYKRFNEYRKDRGLSSIAKSDDQVEEDYRGRGFTWSETEKYGEGYGFWSSIMNNSDFRLYYELYGKKEFAIGDKVALSEMGKSVYPDCYANPHHDIGYISDIEGDSIYIDWSEGINVYNAGHLILIESKQDPKVQKFTIGDTVMLSNQGERNYDNSWNNPWKVCGVITGPSSSLANCYKVRWREVSSCEREYFGYELKLVNNNKKEEDDKILFRITPTITPGEAPSGIVISSPRKEIKLGS